MAVDKNKISAEATRFLQKGQLDKAIKAYERILAADPGDSRALLKIAEIQQKKGDLPAAAETFTRVAEAYGSQGFFLKAVAVYKQVLKLTPDEVRVAERLAQLYQQLGLVSEAMAQLHAIVRLAEKGGDDDKLLEGLRRIVEIDPDDVPSSVKLGELYARLSQPKTAVEHFRRAAELLKRNSRLDEYGKVAERIAALVPEDQALSRELASLFLARGDARRALQKLQECYRVDPRQLETLALLAQVFQELGQETKTAAVFRELGRLHEDEGRPEDAHAAWTRVAELEPDDPEAAEALAGAAPEPEPAAEPRVTGSLTASRAAPAKAAAAPVDGDAALAKVLGEADVYVKYGLHDKALEHLQKIFATDPDHVDAREKASRIREARKDLAGAADDQARAVEGARARGRVDRARTAFERLRQLAPSHPEVARLAPFFQGEPVQDGIPEDGVVLELDALTLEDGADGLTIDVAPEPPLDEVAVAIAEVEQARAGQPAGADPDELALSAVVPDADELIEGDEALASDAEGVLPVGEPARGAPVEAAPASADAAPIELAAEPAQTGSPGADAALEQDLAEAEFFLAQELLLEARELLTDLARRHPDHPVVSARLSELERAERGAVASSAILAPAAGEEAPPVVLAASGPRAIVLPAPTPDYLYSVRDVLEPFKKGIEQTVTPADSQTHYNLGIAYKEMALLGDAIHEFEVALQGSEGARRLDCLMLIGLCRMEGGEHALAIEAYRAALAGGATGDLQRAIEFHLALAYEAAGEPDVALHYLHGLVAADPAYRGAREHLDRLGGGPGRPPASPQESAGPVVATPASVRPGR